VKSKRLVIIGAGGHAREVRWLAQVVSEHPGTRASYAFAGYVVSDTGLISPHDSTDEIIGDTAWLSANRDAFDCLALGIGYAAPRLKVADELELHFGPEYWPALVHPDADFDRRTARIGHGACIFAHVAGTVNLSFGAFSVVNYGCTIGHETVIGRACSLNPGANLSGGVKLGQGVLVGTGAQILQYLEVGDHTTVGAGAVVTRSLPGGVTAVGVPARVR
jgi:sugar O-acyltransferase (sialic acid O-acetyltransferase NeuD family)